MTFTSVVIYIHCGGWELNNITNQLPANSSLLLNEPINYKLPSFRGNVLQVYVIPLQRRDWSHWNVVYRSQTLLTYPVITY